MKTRTLKQTSEDLLQIKEELAMIVSSACIRHYMEEKDAELLIDAERLIDMASFRINLVVEARKHARNKKIREWINEVAEQQEIDNSWDNPYPVLPHESENL